MASSVRACRSARSPSSPSVRAAAAAELGVERAHISFFEFFLLRTSDSLAGRENYGGLEITKIQDPSWPGIRISDNSTWRTATAFGTTFDPCPFVFPGGMYAGTITAGSVTQLFWPATLPSQFRFNVNMPNPAEGAVMRLFVQVSSRGGGENQAGRVRANNCWGCCAFLQQAYTWTVRVNGVAQTMKVAANSSDVPLPTDPAGTFLFDPQLRTLWWTVRGGKAARDIVFVRVRSSRDQTVRGSVLVRFFSI